MMWWSLPETAEVSDGSLEGTVWSWAETSARPCAWGGTTAGPHAGWGLCDPGRLVDKEPNASQRAAAATKAKQTLSCICRGIASRAKRHDHPTQSLSGHVWPAVSNSSPCNLKKRWTDQRGFQRRAMKMIPRAGEPAPWGKTEGVWSLLPGEGSGGPHHSIPVLKGELQREWRLFLHKEPPREDKRQRVQFHQERFHVNIRQKLFLLWEQWTTGTSSAGTW